MGKDNISFEHFDPDLELGKILDAHGKPIKPRKKPGRKPNPPSPAQRKAQNRAAQRAFRERKRREMQEAELTVQQCMDAKNQAVSELEQCKKRMEELEFENQYLKGYVLTLKLTCFAHQIQVPAFGETGAEEMKSTNIPQQLELFLNKNMHIIPLDLSSEQPPPPSILESPLSSSLSSSSSSDLFSDIHSDILNNTSMEEDYVLDDALSTIAPQLASHLENSFFQQLLKTDLVMNRNQGQLCATLQESPRSTIEGPPISSPQVFPLMTSLSVTEKASSDKDSVTATATELQQRVRHDTRIDVIPCAALREHMILFQDFYNANELFNYMTENVTFMDGETWCVPETFFNQYWFLFPNHSIDKVQYKVNTAMAMEVLNKRKNMYLERESYSEHFPNEKEQRLINDILFDDEDATMDYYSQFLEDESTIEDKIDLNAPLDNFMALLNTTTTVNC